MGGVWEGSSGVNYHLAKGSSKETYGYQDFRDEEGTIQVG